MRKSFRYDLTQVIDEINKTSTAEAKLMLDNNITASKTGVFLRSYFSFFTGLFSKSNTSAPIFFRGVERMLKTVLTGLKLLKLQKRI